MSKILILSNHFLTLSLFRQELIKALLEHDHEVVIALPEDRDELFGKMGAHIINVPVDRHGINPMKDLGLLIKYRDVIRNTDPDIVLTYTVKPNLYGGICCRFMGKKYIANITGLGKAIEDGGLIRELTLLLYRIAFKRITCIFVQNEANKQFFIEHRIMPQKLHLLPGSGVNINKFQPIAYPEDNIINFAFISRIMKEKGIDQYLEAAEYIQKKYHNVKFHICGFCEEAYEDKLNELHDKGIIIYHGMVSDVREVLKNCHCTIHPTYYPEGMSNVLLESCACARPIITTNRSGCKEVVDNGINGYLVNERDPQDLIEKIEKFLSRSHEEKKQMGLAGRKKVEKEFDRQIVVDAYLDEIAKIRG